MADICRAVRLAIETRLSDPTNGFNAKYAAIQDSYGVPDLSIDWGDATTNFAWGRVPPDLVEETSPFSYPLLTIDADRGQQAPVQQRIRFKQFSGQVLGWIDLHLSWIEEQVTDFATWPDAAIHAMFDSINDPAIPAAWGAGLLYNGDLNFQKGAILLAGQNWRRTVSFPCSFTVII